MTVFGVDYQFLSCGDVFTQGLVHAAEALGVDYQHGDWNHPNLPALIDRCRPDLLFVVHGRRFHKRFPVPLSRPAAVWLLDEPYEVDDTAAWSHQFDRVFLSDPATLDRHPYSSYLPVCYDPMRMMKPAHSDHWLGRPYGVGFIGGGNQTRERYLSALAGQGFLSYIIGGPWDAPRLQKLNRAGNIPAYQTAAWYQQTRIVLNVFRERHHYNAQKTPPTSLNPRVYEALACGALVISEHRPEVDTLVPELPTFRTVDECLALVAKYLAYPDLAASTQAACAARLAPHTYASRLQTVLQTCGLQVAA